MHDFLHNFHIKRPSHALVEKNTVCNTGRRAISDSSEVFTALVSVSEHLILAWNSSFSPLVAQYTIPHATTSPYSAAWGKVFSSRYCGRPRPTLEIFDFPFTFLRRKRAFFMQVEEFRKVKNVDWLVTHKDHGIKKTHIWIKETWHDKVHCFTAKTADHPLIEVKIMKQKNKGSHKNRKSKRQ